MTGIEAECLPDSDYASSEIPAMKPAETDKTAAKLQLLRAASTGSEPLEFFGKVLRAIEKYPLLPERSDISRRNDMTSWQQDPAKFQTLLIKSSSSGKPYRVPKIVRARLPLKEAQIVIEGRLVERDQYRDGAFRLQTAAPQPAKGITEKLTAASPYFDWTEVWWVPMIVTEAPAERDPIVVGVIQHPDAGRNSNGELSDPARSYYFEIDRWIDDTVEHGWYAFDAY